MNLKSILENIKVTARVITGIRWGHDGDGGADAAAESIIELADAGLKMYEETENREDIRRAALQTAAQINHRMKLGLDSQRLREMAEILLPTIGSENAELRAVFAAMMEKIENIVCTEGEDAGVVLLSNDAPTKYDEELDGQVYLHEFFSPLGDALIDLHRICATYATGEDFPDTNRLDWLNKMNARLNAANGTTYGWRLVLSHNVVRVMPENGIKDIDLNDANGGHHKFTDVRAAIDEQMAKFPLP